MKLFGRQTTVGTGVPDRLAGGVRHRQTALILLVVCAIAGAAAGVVSAVRQGQHFAATVTMQGASTSPTCIYAVCPNAQATAIGYKQLVEQTTLLESRDMAQKVHDNLPNSPSIATLRKNVRARTVGNSFTLSLTYIDRNEVQARRIAWAYAQYYKIYANQYAANQLGAELAVDQDALNALTMDEQLHTARGRELSQRVDVLRVANGVYTGGAGPGSPKIYASTADSLPAQRITPGIAQAGLMGAAAGLVVGVTILLLRRGRGRRGQPAASAWAEQT
jgi:hypothetical protein